MFAPIEIRVSACVSGMKAGENEAMASKAAMLIFLASVVFMILLVFA